MFFQIDNRYLAVKKTIEEMTESVTCYTGVILHKCNTTQNNKKKGLKTLTIGCVLLAPEF